MAGVVAVVAVLALGAGCGDDGPSRAQFAREADAICTPALTRLRAVAARIDAAAAGAANAARADVARIGPTDITALTDRVVVVPAGDEAGILDDSAPGQGR